MGRGRRGLGLKRVAVAVLLCACTPRTEPSAARPGVPDGGDARLARVAQEREEFLAAVVAAQDGGVLGSALEGRLRDEAQAWDALRSGRRAPDGGFGIEQYLPVLARGLHALKEVEIRRGVEREAAAAWRTEHERLEAELSRAVRIRGRHVVGAMPFFPGRDVLADDAASQDVVALLAGALKSCPALRVALGLHHSTEGDREETLSLTKARGGSLRAALLARGVKENTIVKTTGYGAAKPQQPERGASEGEVETARRKNRRIELEVLTPCR